MAVFLNARCAFRVACQQHKYHRNSQKCGKGDLAGLQGQEAFRAKAVPLQENSGQQESGNQRVSTRLNLNGDSDFRVNGLRPALV
jgi:hypothetical protein